MQVYLRLVEHGEDASQQAAALRQCLACMGASYDASPAPAASPRHAAPGGVDHAMLPFLAHFMESQQVRAVAALAWRLHAGGGAPSCARALTAAWRERACAERLALAAPES